MRRFLECLPVSGTAVWAGYLHEGVVWRHGGDGMAARGREEVLRFLRALVGGSAMPCVAVCDLVAEGDTVVARWSLGDAADAARSAREAMGFFMFEDGKIVDVWMVVGNPPRRVS